MKRLFTVLAIVLLVSAATFSQDFCQKGTWELGGSVGFSSSTPVYNGNTGDASSTFQLSPQAGYFITDNFELGLIPLQYVSYKVGSSSIAQFNFLVAPTWNFDSKTNVYPYVQGLLGYGTISAGSSSSLSGLDYGLQGGVKIEVAKSSLINIGLSYVMTNRTPSGVTGRYGSNDLKLVAGFSVFIK